jgi:amino acid transporter
MLPLDDTDPSIQRRTVRLRPPGFWRVWLLGPPLPTAAAPQQTIGKAVGLAVFAADALSSTAYATQEMLTVLAAAGTKTFSYAIPIALAIVGLLALVTLSYRQTIYAYPHGGGAYTVARDNLGAVAAQVAGAALLLDYILTVAVSVSSGVAQITSASPGLMSYRGVLAVGLVMVIMLVNLRGVKESGVVFAAPTYLFLVMMGLMLGTGGWRAVMGTLRPMTDPPSLETLRSGQAITLFLLLHAFSSGTTALTGVEAIANGVTAFHEPRSRNASMTLIWMSTILGSLFLGMTILAYRVEAVPSEAETVISQVARTVFAGQGLLYLSTIVATTVILIMAANTAFADFPRLSALHARDGYLPRQFLYRGSRLVYSRGIMALALIASLLIIVFDARVSALIPLYAIGVFLSFTLSQAGMARRWWKIRRLTTGQAVPDRALALQPEPRWWLKLMINGIGAICTLVVVLVFVVTKFTEGAWIVLLLLPMLVAVFRAIHRHYRTLDQVLSLAAEPSLPRYQRHAVILPISGIHRATRAALSYALMLSDDVTAVHVALDPAEATRVREQWHQWGEGVRLVILDSPYRQLLEPLLAYFQEIVAQRQPRELITVVVPQFVPRSWWHNLLHTQTAMWLRLALLFQPGIVVTDVPFHVDYGTASSGATAHAISDVRQG